MNTWINIEHLLVWIHSSSAIWWLNKALTLYDAFE